MDANAANDLQRDDATPREARWERNFIWQMKRLREQSGWTQTDLARHLSRLGLKFHQQTIQRIEAGERPIRLDEANLIALLFGEQVERMSTTTAPDERDLQLAVDRLRVEAGSTVSAIQSLVDNWMGVAENIAVEAHQRAVPGVTRATDMDPSARWSLEWSVTALRAYEALVEAAEVFVRIERAEDYTGDELPVFELEGDPRVFGDIRKLQAVSPEVLKWTRPKATQSPLPVPKAEMDPRRSKKKHDELGERLAQTDDPVEQARILLASDYGKATLESTRKVDEALHARMSAAGWDQLTEEARSKLLNEWLRKEKSLDVDDEES